MWAGLLLYNLLGGFLFLMGFPFLLLYHLAQGKYSHRFVERLGRYPQRIRSKKGVGEKGPIWVHAVSVGEIKAAVHLIDQLKKQLPEAVVLISTTTPAGRETAAALLGADFPLIYFPFDFYFCVQRALRSIRPRAFVILETELWPNFLYLVQKSGCPVFLANGRISQPSFKRYQRIRWLLQPLLSRFQMLLVRDGEDAHRFITLGARPDSVRVLGNIKYDGLAARASAPLAQTLRKRLEIPEGQPVWVTGSTRSGEEAMVLEVFQELKVLHPSLILILAPRHIDRCPQIEKGLKEQGVTYQLYSRLHSGKESRVTDVVLVDRIGDLFSLYGLATVVFCGASLVPKGGQNIMEPAAWGKVVLYGPYMEDFKDARFLLERVGAGFMVRGREELKERLRYFLEHPEEREKRGRAAREALRSQEGVTRKAAEIIAQLLRFNP